MAARIEQLYLDALTEVGEDVIIRNYDVGAETYTDKTARARVTDFSPDQLVGPIVQGDRKLIMLAADVSGVTLALTQNCKVIVRGKELQVKSIDDNSRRVSGVLMAYELVVGG